MAPPIYGVDAITVHPLLLQGTVSQRVGTVKAWTVLREVNSSKALNYSGGPARQDRRFSSLRLKIAVDAKTGGPDQLSSAEHEWQPLPPPGRHIRFLQQV